MNYCLTIQYDGTDFHGWQMQRQQRTVQGELTRVLQLLDGREEVTVHGAGRTDAGVHAEAQVATVHLRRDLGLEKLRAAINGNLARDVRVLEVERVAEDFNARFSARGKTYGYRIFNAPIMSPLWARFALHEARRVDINKIREMAPLFRGTHDWTAFASIHTDVRTRVRNLTRLDVVEHWSACGRGRMIEITVSADGFLRYMVRSIVGALLAAGRGEVTPDEIQSAIATGQRVRLAPTAPAHGLTLKQVHY